MFLLKIHCSEKRNVAAVCDSELLGKSFSSQGFCLEVNEHFFGGKSAGIDEIICALKSSETANIVGNRIVAELLGCGTIKQGGVKEIDGIKYAMVFTI